MRAGKGRCVVQQQGSAAVICILAQLPLPFWAWKSRTTGVAREVKDSSQQVVIWTSHQLLHRRGSKEKIQLRHWNGLPRQMVEVESLSLEMFKKRLGEANEKCQRRVAELNGRWKRIFKLQQTVGSKGRGVQLWWVECPNYWSITMKTGMLRGVKCTNDWGWYFYLHYVFDYWICALENSINETAQSSFNICMKMKLSTKQYTHFSLIWFLCQLWFLRWAEEGLCIWIPYFFFVVAVTVFASGSQLQGRNEAWSAFHAGISPSQNWRV